ncbi:MAG: hypothetical protein AAF593_00520 [Planctomycetota bacterium]
MPADLIGYALTTGFGLAGLRHGNTGSNDDSAKRIIEHYSVIRSNRESIVKDIKIKSRLTNWSMRPVDKKTARRKELSCQRIKQSINRHFSDSKDRAQLNRQLLISYSDAADIYLSYKNIDQQEALKLAWLIFLDGVMNSFQNCIKRRRY